jgi:quercetin dioxygenase-like cupin family protein
MSTPEGPQALADLAAFAPETIVSRVLLKRPTGSVTLFAFGKDEGLSEHTAPFEALIVVLEGAAEVTIGGVQHAVASGESIHLPASIPHAVQAPEDMRMLLIMLRS